MKYLCSVMTNHAGCACDIKCRTGMTKAAFKKKKKNNNNNKTLFNSKLDLDIVA